MLLRVKKFSEKLMLPLGKKLIKIPANVITLLGLFFSLLAFFGFIFQNLIFIIICLFLVEFFDQLDGVIARLQGPTMLGAFLDSTLDRIGDFLLFFGIILGGYTEVYIGFLALAGAFLTSYTRAKIEALGIPTAIWWTMIFLAIGTNITAIQRIVYAIKKFSVKNNK